MRTIFDRQARMRVRQLKRRGFKPGPGWPEGQLADLRRPAGAGAVHVRVFPGGRTDAHYDQADLNRDPVGHTIKDVVPYLIDKWRP